MKYTCVCLLVLFGFSTALMAQPDHYNFNTLGQSNSMPWNLPAGKRVQILYQPGAFAQPSPAGVGAIHTLSFLINQTLGPYTYNDLTIQLGQTPATALPTTGFYVGSMDTVYYRPSVSLSGSTGQWMNIVLDNSFVFDPLQSLVLEISHCGAPGAAGFSACFTPVGNVTRCWSVGGCPFVYSTWSNQVYHMGISMNPVGTGINEVESDQVRISNTDGQLLANFSLPTNRMYSMCVSDMLGSLKLEQADFAVRGQTERILDTRLWPNGIYLVTFFAGDFRVSRRIVVTH